MNHKNHKVLRICRNDLTSKNGFKYKRKGMVYCPDYVENFNCGNGLHGFLNFQGDPTVVTGIDGLRKYLLIDVKNGDLCILKNKCKFKQGNVIECHNNLIDLIENNLSLLESLKTKNLAFEFTKDAKNTTGIFAYSYFGNAESFSTNSVAISRVGEAKALGIDSWADGFTKAITDENGYARVRKIGGIITISKKDYIVNNKKYKVGVWYKYSCAKNDLIKVR